MHFFVEFNKFEWPRVNPYVSSSLTVRVCGLCEQGGEGGAEEALIWRRFVPPHSTPPSSQSSGATMR